MQVGLLGLLTVRAGGGVVPLTGRKPRAVLSLLALRVGRVVSTDEIVDALWGEDPPPSARKAVQTYVSTLRRALPDVVESVAGGYRLRVEPDDVDAEMFVRMVMTPGTDTASDSESTARRLRAALALWRGPPLPDLADHEVGAAESRRLVELRLQAEDDLGAVRLALGGDRELVGDCERAVRAEPLREGRWALLVTALYRTGRQADALRAFQRLRAVLGDQLGLDPSPELQALERAVLAHSPTLLGVHANRGHIDAQVVPEPAEAHAPLTAAKGTSVWIPLIGRGAVVGQITSLLASRRLVTLTGAAGVGKTSVASAVVDAAVAKFPDGIGWADLTVLSPAGDVVRALGDAVGVIGEPGRLELHALTRALEDRRVLLVVDNCEHVLDGVASAVRAILTSHMDAAVLCTSREPLGIAGEEVVVLPALGFDGEDSPAVDLLRERIGNVGGETDEDRAALVDLAARLEGLPLALELAAARCRSLGTSEVARRLEHRFDLLSDRHRSARHRSLDAALSWSYELLDANEQAVFRRLAVFAGPFSLDAAECVGREGDDVSRLSVDEAVSALVDKSLVSRTGAYFRLLDTTRAFARRHLCDSGSEPAALAAHIAWMVERVQEIRRGLRSPDEKRWVAVLDAEWADVRTALERSFEADHADPVITILVHLALEAIWRRPEVLPWIEEAARRYGDRPGPHQHELLGAGCFSAFTAGRFTDAVRRAERALAVDPNPGTAIDVLPEAGAAGAAYFAGDYTAGMAACRRALDHQPECEDPIRRAMLHSSYALCAAAKDPADAQAASVRARDAAVLTGNPSLIAYTTWIYGSMTPAEAGTCLGSAQALASEVGLRFVSGAAGHAKAVREWAALLEPRSGDAAQRVVASLVALAGENYRAGWLTHARTVGRDLAAMLFDLDRTDVAAALLGGCDAFGASAMPINGPLSPALERLSRGAEDGELERYYSLGRRTRFPVLLRVAGGEEPLTRDAVTAAP